MQWLLVLAAFLWFPEGTPHFEACTATLAIVPASGTVGTVVTVTGRGFSAACPLLRGTNGDGLILMSGGGSSTFGYAPVADPGREPPVAVNGTFSLAYTIPPTLRPFHGVGGGPVRPGPYNFQLQPPVTQAIFTVAGLPALPATGAGGLVMGGKRALLLRLSLALGLVLARNGQARGATLGRSCHEDAA